MLKKFLPTSVRSPALATLKRTSSLLLNYGRQLGSANAKTHASHCGQISTTIRNNISTTRSILAHNKISTTATVSSLIRVRRINPFSNASSVRLFHSNIVLKQYGPNQPVPRPNHQPAVQQDQIEFYVDSKGYKHWRKHRTPLHERVKDPRILALIAAAVLGIGAFVISHLETAPITGRKRVIAVSPKREQAMGLTEFQNFCNANRNKILPPNHPSSVLVKRVGSRIAAVSGATDFQWEFIVVDSPEVNAFCLPGGKVVMFTGLLKHLNENQVAAVMGHEIAHALARHSGEKMTFGFALMFVQIAMSVLLSNSSRMLNKLTHYLLFLPNSRAMEAEADHIGLLLMAKACYPPREAIGMYQILQRLSAGHPHYLSTHPSHDRRITAVQELIPKAEQEAARSCVTRGARL